MRVPHVDTASIVALLIDVGSVPFNVDRASAGIISDLTQNKCNRVPDHHSVLKILHRILFWVTALGGRELLNTGNGRRVIPHHAGTAPSKFFHRARGVLHALQFSLLLILYHEGS